MTTSKAKALYEFKSVKPRYIVLNEDIRQALDLYSLSLYLTFRYHSSFSQECSEVKRSAKFLYTDAKISRAQFFRCLNILENHGLILRESDNSLNSISVYNVAHDLHYFNTNCGVVSDRDGVVSDRDTDHQSLSLSNLNTITEKAKKTEKKTLKNPLLEEIKEAYHETFPDLPEVRNVYGGMAKQLTKMIKNWPNYQQEGKDFSIESFRNYLLVMKNRYAWFLLPFPNENGKMVKCTLKKLTTDENISKVVNGEFSES